MTSILPDPGIALHTSDVGDTKHTRMTDLLHTTLVGVKGACPRGRSSDRGRAVREETGLRVRARLSRRMVLLLGV